MYEECIVLHGGSVLEIRLGRDLEYVLRLRKARNSLVEYCSNGASGHVRRARGRQSAYEFKSVEQLRYDFERDAEDAQRQG
ncbi:MAG: hypothetical protein EPO29_05145 [Betaproteobacteria bacterium]|nr:MAG: hypothetical protein EPO29_05145 [Betaproteobacteria bacterium]